MFSDADIRPALRSFLRKQHSRGGGVTVLEELGICRGKARVDLAVVDRQLHGYEVKSDRDSLRRLARQVDVYGKVLDRATLVVGERHFADATDAIPDWWGVIRVYANLGEPRFTTYRRGRKNPGRDSRALVELLWLEDALALLSERDAVRGVRGKPRRIVWERVCEHFAVDDIAAAVREQLRARAAQLGTAQPC